MSCVDVTHQRELDEAAARGDCAHYAGSATVSAYGSATVSASKFVAIHRHGDRITVTEGTTATIIDVPSCDVLDEWVDYHGIGRDEERRTAREHRTATYALDRLWTTPAPDDPAVVAARELRRRALHARLDGREVEEVTSW